MNASVGITDRPLQRAVVTHEMQDLSLSAKAMRILLIGDDPSDGLLSVREVLADVRGRLIHRRMRDAARRWSRTAEQGRDRGGPARSVPAGQPGDRSLRTGLAGGATRPDPGHRLAGRRGRRHASRHARRTGLSPDGTASTATRCREPSSASSSAKRRKRRCSSNSSARKSRSTRSATPCSAPISRAT